MSEEKPTFSPGLSPAASHMLYALCDEQEKFIEELERERDEAVALLRDILTSVQDIDPRMSYVDAQITREELAAIDDLIARLDHD